MEALGDLLAPHSEHIAKVAGTITTLQFLSGIAVLNDIRKKGSSDVYPVGPFLGGVVLTVLSLKLATIMNDAAMINTNLIGLVINFVFFGGFYYYASSGNRGIIRKQFGYASLFLLVCTAYANFEDPKKIEFRLGMLITGIFVWLVGSPLLHLPKIIEKKSTEGMPFPIILSGNLVATSWMLYAISIKNTVMVLQNLLLLVLGGIQLSMFAIYPNKPTAKKLAAKNESKKEN
ncbi:sugar transporter SWEET1 isoform X1 [Drosophila guanche]|uniref:Sugar transporter SWEET n=1 Tax=Drosophila guanche TaxID=7266 RepID=A0A3B0KMB0_DROGU|nr:sugar transporter SWEET1 isoform X1 [Drosophila guanche]SPP89760.1 blast:Sugar transporter SWEET1 [Drosophila guanche]